MLKISSSKEKLALNKIFTNKSSEHLSPSLTLLSNTNMDLSLLIREKKELIGELSNSNFRHPENYISNAEQQELQLFFQKLEEPPIEDLRKPIKPISIESIIESMESIEEKTSIGNLTPLTPQENNSLEENFNTLSVDWRNATKNFLPMKEVAIKVKRGLEEIAIKNKRKVQEAQIRRKQELQEINEKKFKAKREAEEAKLHTRVDPAVQSLNNKEKTLDQISNLDQIIEKIEWNLKKLENKI